VLPPFEKLLAEFRTVWSTFVIVVSVVVGVVVLVIVKVVLVVVMVFIVVVEVISSSPSALPIFCLGLRGITYREPLHLVLVCWR
jgi:hypothetical protein